MIDEMIWVEFECIWDNIEGTASDFIGTTRRG